MEDTAGTAHGGADMKATTGRLTPENRPLLPSTSTAMGSAEGGGAKTSDVGLCNVWALWYLALWYLFSGLTLFLNKYILMTLEGDATLLGTCQMLLTLGCGYAQVVMERKGGVTKKPNSFYRHMVIVGGMRYATVLLGLIALNYVAVSFTETVKSSAPAFTVIISRLLLGQVNIRGVWWLCSDFDIQGDRILCEFELAACDGGACHLLRQRAQLQHDGLPRRLGHQHQRVRPERLLEDAHIRRRVQVHSR